MNLVYREYLWNVGGSFIHVHTRDSSLIHSLTIESQARKGIFIRGLTGKHEKEKLFPAV
jgi:hypothetical protein